MVWEKLHWVPTCHRLAQPERARCGLTDVIEENSVVRLEFGDCGMSVRGCCTPPGSPAGFCAHPPLLSIANPTLYVPLLYFFILFMFFLFVFGPVIGQSY